MRRFGAISGLRARLLPMNPPSTVKPDTRARPAMYPAGYNASAAGDGTEYGSGSFKLIRAAEMLAVGPTFAPRRPGPLLDRWPHRILHGRVRPRLERPLCFGAAVCRNRRRSARRPRPQRQTAQRPPGRYPAARPDREARVAGQVWPMPDQVDARHSLTG